MAKVSDNILKRVYILFGLFLIFSFMIFIQVTKIQYIEGDKWLEKQQKDRIYTKKVIADRGSILASDGSILAITLPFYRIALDATVINKKNFVNFDDSLNVLCTKLEKYYGKGELKFKDFKFKILEAQLKKDRHVYLFPMNRTFNYQEMKHISSFPIFNQGKNAGGLIVEKINNKRFFPYGDLAKITLGILKDDTLGIRGLEYAYNEELRGKDGLMMVQKIAGGAEIPLESLGYQESKDGFDIKTTLDVNLQDIVSTALQRGVEKTEAKGGVAILMEVKTGHVKAIANYPENYNTAIGSQLEPGSTFKIATLMAALEDNKVDLKGKYSTGGEVELYTSKMKDPADYGDITIKQAFEKSSNIVFSQLIDSMYKDDPSKFIDKLEQIGILKHTGTQIKGEPDPYVIKPKDKLWSASVLPWLAIGYNIKLTPLQILTFVNGIANHGKLISPVLVQEIKNNSELFAKFKTQIINERMCSAKTLEILQEYMLDVVEYGTARNIKDKNYKIAGKTGTVQKYVGGKYQKKYRSSFVGYFPAENPRYSVYVMVDEPSLGEYYGSEVAAPIFKEIADYVYYKDLDIHKDRFRQVNSIQKAAPDTKVAYKNDLLTIYEQLNISVPDQPSSDYVKVDIKKKFVELKEQNYNGKYVPNCKGMSAKDAVPLLENMSFIVKLKGHGKVKYQSIAPGEPISYVSKKRVIYLTLE